MEAYASMSKHNAVQPRDSRKMYDMQLGNLNQIVAGAGTCLLCNFIATIFRAAHEAEESALAIRPIAQRTTVTLSRDCIGKAVNRSAASPHNMHSVRGLDIHDFEIVC